MIGRREMLTGVAASHLTELRPGQTEEEAINIYGRIRVEADDFLVFLTGPAQALR